MAVSVDLTTGKLTGDGITTSARMLGGLQGYFREEAVHAAMDQEQVIYRVEAFEPVPEGQEGAVCCATTFLEPGKVGDEYFLTRGHFHTNQDRPEMEVTIAGEGALVLMGEDRRTWIEPMRPGSVHHVPPRTAHRVANTGSAPLVFISYWPSETGHDYKTIVEQGFSARVRSINDIPTLVGIL